MVYPRGWCGCLRESLLGADPVTTARRSPQKKEAPISRRLFALLKVRCPLVEAAPLVLAAALLRSVRETFGGVRVVVVPVRDLFCDEERLSRNLVALHGLQGVVDDLPRRMRPHLVTWPGRSQDVWRGGG